MANARSSATPSDESALTLKSLREAVFSDERERISHLYLDSATLQRIFWSVRVKATATDRGTYMGIPYTVSPNVEGWCFVDAEGNVLAPSLAVEPVKEEGDG